MKEAEGDRTRNGTASITWCSFRSRRYPVCSSPRIHQGEECNLDCPELSGTETPFDREEFLSARLFRFHGGDGQTIRAGIHLAAGAGGAAFGGAEHGVGASAAFRRLLTGPFEGLTEISPRLCRGSLTFWDTNSGTRRKPRERICFGGAKRICVWSEKRSFRMVPTGAGSIRPTATGEKRPRASLFA